MVCGRGRGVKYDPVTTGSNLDLLALKDLHIKASSGQNGYSNIAGLFGLPAPPQPAIYSAKLSGRWANVHSVTSSDLILNLLGIPGTFLEFFFHPTGADGPLTAQVNGYYHATLIHDWVQARLPNSQAIDIPLTVNVNGDWQCGAYYDDVGEVSIRFPRAGGGCINAAFDTAIYHEYGHFIDDRFGGITTYELSEGWGDLLATFATGQPLIGEGWQGPGTIVRTAENSYQYPYYYRPSNQPAFDSHEMGQAWAGFAWRLRKSLIATLGPTQGAREAERLIIPVFQANSENIPAAMADVLVLDDDDGDVQNGTPHAMEIIKAATAHAIPLWMFVRIDRPGHHESIGGAGEETITISGRATAIKGTFTQYALFYGRGRDPQQWVPIGQPSHTPILDGPLGTWSIKNLQLDDLYALKLVVTTRDGLQIQDVVEVLPEPGDRPFLLGDFNRDGRVTVDELVLAINFTLGNRIPTATQLAAIDRNGDGKVAINELVTAVNNALKGPDARQIDGNANGRLDSPELQGLMRRAQY